MTTLHLISKSGTGIAKHVIFIHGLGGHPRRTWQALNDADTCWLEWLAQDIPGLGVWTVEYDAAVSRWHGKAMHLADRATNILENIFVENKLETGEIVIVGHSLGGLLIKQMLRTTESMAKGRRIAASFLDRVSKIAFIATPHAGADAATWADRFRVFFRPSIATASLVRNDPNLRDLNYWYRESQKARRVEHLVLIESSPTWPLGILVKPDTGDPGLSDRPIQVDADHVNICKLKSRDSEVYRLIMALITREPGQPSSYNFSREMLESQERILEKLTVLSERPSLPVLHSRQRELVDKEILNHLTVLRQSRFFRGYKAHDQAIRCSERLIKGDLEGGSDEVRSMALAWCARLLALGEHRDKAIEILDLAKHLGSGPEVVIAEAIVVAGSGQLDQALGKLSSIESPTTKSARFIVVSHHHKNEVAALEWLERTGWSLSDIDSDGKFIAIVQMLACGRWGDALRYGTDVTDEDFGNTPPLMHACAMAKLMPAIAEELREVVLQQIPFQAKTFPLASNEAALAARREAKDLLLRCAQRARVLECLEAAHGASDYALWLELRDPVSYERARKALEFSMREPAHSLRRVHLALQYGITVDIEAVEREMDRQTTISGGASSDAALARFALAFKQDSPKAVAEYIDKHRSQLVKHIHSKTILMIEVEMLAKAGLSQHAEEKLSTLLKEGLSEVEQSRIRTLISDCSGVDSLADRKRQFEKTGQLIDLANLVAALEEREDWPELAKYAAPLFEKTRETTDLVCFSRALSKTGLHRDLVALLRQRPEYLDQSDELLMFWSWSLYSEGLLSESSDSLKKLLDKRDHPNDRALAVKIAISSGNWEALATIVENEWIHRSNRTARDLLQAAQLAYLSSSPRSKELVYEVVAKNAHDPEVLVQAYYLATTSGWENDPAVAAWLQKAAELSGDSGPIQRMSLKEILERKPHWDNRESEVWDQVRKGVLPLFGAAYLLNRSPMELFLLPTLANPTEIDPRKRSMVPAYSGTREAATSAYRTIVVDPTALLTLATLNMLDKGLAAFEKVIIPHSTLGWLFAERLRVTFHQPSRVRDAENLRGLLATGAVKEFHPSTIADPDLASEVGEELAGMIGEARTIESVASNQRFVVRSRPVYRVGSLMEEEADLTAYHAQLCSCGAVVEKLRQKAQITSAEEALARSYLKLHEHPWTNESPITDGAILYLDDLSVTYLQHVGLLGKLRDAGLIAYISARESDQCRDLLRIENLGGEAMEIIDLIRRELASGIESGRILIGRRSPSDSDNEIERHPTFDLLHIAGEAEAALVDDRALNQHKLIDCGTVQVPVITTFDLLCHLQTTNKITQDELRELTTRLRRAGYIFMPITSDEIEHYLSTSIIHNNAVIESTELRVLRESLLRIRSSTFLQLPKEARWLDLHMKALARALKVQWRPGKDSTVAEARSNWLLDLLHFGGWSHCFAELGNQDMAVFAEGTHLMLLMSPDPEMDSEMRMAYWDWLEKRILVGIRDENPELHKWLLKQIENLIDHAVTMLHSSQTSR